MTRAQHRANELCVKASFTTNQPGLTAKHLGGWFVGGEGGFVFVVWVLGGLVVFFGIHRLQHSITG